MKPGDVRFSYSIVSCDDTQQAVLCEVEVFCEYVPENGLNVLLVWKPDDKPQLTTLVDGQVRAFVARGGKPLNVSITRRYEVGPGRWRYATCQLR